MFMNGFSSDPSVAGEAPVPSRSPLSTDLEARLPLATKLLRPLKRLVKASPVWPLLRPRRFQAYCVGPAKSGTTSIGGMFETRYRSGHELHLQEVIEMIVLRMAGRLSPEAAMRRLRKRDRELRLEMDSFNQLAFFAEDLASAFPGALFLLTVRDPRPWLNSIINQHLRVDVSKRPPERLLRQLLFMPPGVTYGPGEDELRRLGVFPLDGYLKAWSAHYRQVIEGVPSDRLLVIPTEALTTSVDRIAAFLSIPADTIDASRAHLHARPRDHGVMARLDPALVEDKVHSHCGEVLSRLASVVEAGSRDPVRPQGAGA
jgi:hypothetical protein